ncbi:MAG: hypothetical protein EP330_05315 [Deltaproteobacteria bacterium]|nr:MAG: hypothetical protein EP330_05315 [Deltaproteobacteria bacterium]
MPGRGQGYHRRLFFLERIGEEDPELYAELLELRASNPQKFRKRLRTLAEGKGRVGPGRKHSSPVPWDEAPASLREVAPHGVGIAEQTTEIGGEANVIPPAPKKKG